MGNSFSKDINKQDSITKDTPPSVSGAEGAQFGLLDEVETDSSHMKTLFL